MWGKSFSWILNTPNISILDFTELFELGEKTLVHMLKFRIVRNVPLEEETSPSSAMSMVTPQTNQNFIDWKSVATFIKHKMPRKRAVMTDAERAELPSSLFLLSGTNPFRRAAVWLVRWIVFEWIIILTIIGKNWILQWCHVTAVNFKKRETPSPQPHLWMQYEKK